MNKAYIPGAGPKPEIEIHKSTVELSLQNFRSHPSFIQAAELFNQCYYWEAHEVFECLWREVGTESIERTGLQILIKLCALQLKIQQQQAKAAEQLHDWICKKIERSLPAHPNIYGVSLKNLREKLLQLEKSSFSKKLNVQILL